MYYRVLFFTHFLTGFILLSSACEGECIVGITKAFLGNYSVPVDSVLRQLGQQISSELLPPSSRPADPLTLLLPIKEAYHKTSYTDLENAIFPSYFHGKCQRFSKDGQDPPGCPNPDCPVVCGTPGSLVHFYSTLRFIGFNSTKTTLMRLMEPGNPAYEQVNKQVLSSQSMRKRSITATHEMDMMPDSLNNVAPSKRMLSSSLGSVANQRSVLWLSTRSSPTLADILAGFANLFIGECGGNARDSKDALPKCSWEDDMKKYILAFP